MSNSSPRASSKVRTILPQDTQLVIHSSPECEEEEELLMNFDDDDLPPIERVKLQQEINPPRLFHTMRQQAKSKHHNKKSKVSNTKPGTSRPATLELPSPPPPPRETKVAESQKQKHDVKSEQPAESASLICFQKAIASLLQSLPCGAENSDVVIQFGLTLMTNAEDLAAKKALRCAELQDVLDRRPTERYRTTFLTAIGRKNKDGIHLLRLPTTLPGSESPYAGSSQLTSAWIDCEEYGINDRRLYEITIVAPGGHEWMLVFDQGSPEDVQIMLSDAHQQSVYVHYPLRVWDARVQLLPAAGPEPESILKSKIMTFLKTFNTPKPTSDKERPFFDATIPDAAFRVTSVLLKRVLATKLRSGTWKVTQAYNLHVDLNRGNVSVFAKTENLMEQEGRIWWEAALQYDGREEFESTMNEVMERLDDVGWESPAPSAPSATKKGKAKEPEYNPRW